MVERVFNRMKHYSKAATRYDGLDEAFLAGPPAHPHRHLPEKRGQKPN